MAPGLPGARRARSGLVTHGEKFVVRGGAGRCLNVKVGVCCRDNVDGIDRVTVGCNDPYRRLIVRLNEAGEYDDPSVHDEGQVAFSVAARIRDLHESGAQRSQRVEIGLRVAQIGPRQPDAAQVGVSEIGAVQVGVLQIRILQIGVAEIGIAKIGGLKACILHVAGRQVAVPQIACLQSAA